MLGRGTYALKKSSICIMMQITRRHDKITLHMLNICKSTQALVQPDYANNWWSQPAMPNNENGWQGRQDSAQWQNNQASYPAKGWATYPMGGYMDHAIQNITDWAPGDPTPSWSPVAGGKGFGNPAGAGSGNSSVVPRAKKRQPLPF